MKSFPITFDAEPLGHVAPLTLSFSIDEQVLWQGLIDRAQTVRVEWPEDDAPQNHALKFQMSGKRIEHTTMENHVITADCSLRISNFTMDGILIQQHLENHNRYCHDHNGNSDPVCEQFYGIMGCNGTVELQFNTPVYVWFLETL